MTGVVRQIRKDTPNAFGLAQLMTVFDNLLIKSRYSEYESNGGQTFKNFCTLPLYYQLRNNLWRLC